MTKASDKLLGELHGKLATSMMNALQESDEAQILLDIYAEELPQEVADFLEKKSSASPSLLTAITKFLKDNNVTCSIEDSEEVNELAERLNRKARKKAIGNVIPFDEG